MGIERSFRSAKAAEIVVFLGDAAVLSEEAFQKEAELLTGRIGSDVRVIPVLNKLDRSPYRPEKVLGISAKHNEGLDELKQRFVDHVHALHTDPGDIVVTNARHVEALSHARNALLAAKGGIEQGIGGELVASDLRRAQHHLGEITGRITPDDLLGSIFGRFCIGK
jgi:tRNA modification GTPase